MHRAHKIRLNLNNTQKTYCAKAAGTARFAYNWALNKWNEDYQAHIEDPSQPKPNQFSLRKHLNSIKKEQFPWMLEVTKCAPQMAIIQLGDAWKRCWSGQNQRPTWKKKGRDDSFTVSNDQIKVSEDGTQVRLPHIGWVSLSEKVRFMHGKLLSATISRHADQWYISFCYSLPDPVELPKSKKVIGVDLGIKTFATLSTGESIEGPNALKKYQKQLKHLDREMARRFKRDENKKPVFSKNYMKTKKKRARLFVKMKNMRGDFHHKFTTSLVEQADTIVIESLNVKGMMKNHKLAKAISDQGWYEFKRQLRYKGEAAGRTIVEANPFFPSSKTCSSCGHVLEVLPLSVRDWTCPNCKTHHERDLNAAKNLATLPG